MKAPDYSRPSYLPAVGAQAPSHIRRRRSRLPPYHVLLPSALVGAAMLLPLAYLLLRGAGATDAAWELLFRARTAHILARTALLVLSVTAVSVALAAPLAWLTVRTDLPFRRVWSVLAVLPLVIPSYVGAFLFVSALGPRGLLQQMLSEPFGIERLPEIYGFPGATITLALLSYPYVLLTMRGAMVNVDPALEDSARSLGYGAWSTARYVTLPLLRPAAAAGALLVALYTISDFGAVSLMRYETFSWSIYQQYQSSFDRSIASVLALVLVALAAVVLIVEQLSRGRLRYYRSGAGASRVPSTVRLGGWKWPAVVFCGAVVGLAVAVPMGVLAYWLVRGASSAQSAGIPWSAAWSSVYASALAALGGRRHGCPDGRPARAPSGQDRQAAGGRELHRIRAAGSRRGPGPRIFRRELRPSDLPDHMAAHIRLRRAIFPGRPRRRQVLAAAGESETRGRGARTGTDPDPDADIGNRPHDASWDPGGRRPGISGGHEGASGDPDPGPPGIQVAGDGRLERLLRGVLRPGGRARSDAYRHLVGPDGVSRHTRWQVERMSVPVVTCEGVTKSYGGTVAVDGIDLRLEPAAILAILGPSGCGKTTLLRLIAGFESVDRGEISIHGRLVSSAAVHDPPNLRNVGTVFQENAPFPHLTVTQNVSFGLRGMARRERERRLGEMLEVVRLQGKETSYPHELSGGEQQRVAVARTLAPRPAPATSPEVNASWRAPSSIRGPLAAFIRNAVDFMALNSGPPIRFLVPSASGVWSVTKSDSASRSANSTSLAPVAEAASAVTYDRWPTPRARTRRPWLRRPVRSGPGRLRPASSPSAAPWAGPASRCPSLRTSWRCRTGRCACSRPRAAGGCERRCRDPA